MWQRFSVFFRKCHMHFSWAQGVAGSNPAIPTKSPRSVLSEEVTLHSERMGKVNSIHRRNTICDRRRHGCALVQDVVE